MASEYTVNSGIEKPGSGEQSGTWGATTNTNFDIIDRVLSGVGTITLSGTTHTLTTSDGAASEGHYRVLLLAGSPSGQNTITISPADQEKLYFVYNNSGQSVIFTQGSGGNVTISQSDYAIIYADGEGSTAKVTLMTWGAAQIKNNAITTDKIEDDAVTAAKIADAERFASGTKMLFQQTAAPTGWTKDTSHNNKALRVVSGTVGTGGTRSFTGSFQSHTPAGTISNSVSGSTASHTLTTSQIPAHGHSITGTYTIDNGSGGGGSFPHGSARSTPGVSISNFLNISASNTGGGGSHSHGAGSLSVSSSFSGTAINLDVQHVDVIICTKD
jgi:hypothetical protein